MFSDNLIHAIKFKNNPTVVGLDPRIESIPEFIKKAAFNKYGNNTKGISEAIYYFNKGIVDAVFDVVPAVKIQIAFYEIYGANGIEAFYKTAEYAKEKGLMVIADVKRGDIADVAEMYSKAYLQNPSIDAITINPYMGEDTITPYIRDVLEYDKGLFILVKTSNAGSGTIQNLKTVSGTVYENVAHMVDKISKLAEGSLGYSSIGAVVGATYKEEAKILRKIMPSAIFLVPGYGAQGATAEDVINCFDENNLGAIVNSSRKVIFAYKSQYWKDVFSEYEFAQAARAEVLLMMGMINNAFLKRRYIAC
ncbi:MULTISPECIES: orotidine-5'-phosphate decarboxylase [unclassified Thermoanaerobacterium]|uniref:orotidine-5'-phosphate decarboxylase n=1 Tax=unclassified Thermoanaerobacterium TaxID=2622527 RepID=UPI000A15AF7F|nr:MULTISPECIES: orotidine-5'-phosphate decarboxylase [unclassified Thermoanaerobacterium]MDE4541918.1 orotidine-5'-phosphate decarboxylase [Thermoanaerobacterium sp. R66]ORX23898.1 orotidine-5'-phosphate decarboxylase [Thermoanaerobacterium sp. PSU-2]